MCVIVQLFNPFTVSSLFSVTGTPIGSVPRA